MKDKYNKNRDKEGKFYELCAKIWGDLKEELRINSSPTIVLFENDSNVHDSCAADTDVVELSDDSYVDSLYVEDSYAEDDSYVNSLYVEDSYAEDSENNNENHDNNNNNEEENDLIRGRRAEIKRKFEELDIMMLQLFLKRLALMKETIDAVLEVIQ